MGREQILVPSKFKLLSRSSSHLQINLSHFFDFLLLVVGLSLGIVVIYVVTSFWYVAIDVPTPGYMKTPIPSAPGHRDLLEQGHSLFPSRFLGLSAWTNGARATDHGNAAVTVEKVSRNRMHNMSDDELLGRAAMVQGKDFSNGSVVPKVAFMFLTYGPVHLSPVWEKFFRGHQGFYSIYWHARPSYEGSMPIDSVFYGTIIPSQVKFIFFSCSKRFLLF